MTDIENTLAERGERYGSSFAVQSVTAQYLKSVMRNTPNWKTLDSDAREALDMVATKISRILHGDPKYHDSWHDLVGYSKLVADALLGDEK